MKLIKFAVCVAIACLFTVSAHARPIHTEDHFTITVPDNWTQLPSAELHSYSATVGKLMPELKSNLNYVLQPAQNQPFSYPYVTILVKKVSGAMPSSPQVLIDEMNKETKGATKDVEGKANGIVSDLQVSEAWWDEDSQMVRMKGRMNVANLENVYGMIGIKFFKGGYVQVNCYAPASEIKEYMSLYEDILDSVTIDTGWEASMGIGLDSLDTLTGGNSKLTIWSVLLVAALTGLGFWNTRRKTPKARHSEVIGNSAAQAQPTTSIISLKENPELVLTDKIYNLLNESEGVMTAYLFNYRQAQGILQPTLGVKFEDSISLKSRQMAWQKIKAFCENQATLGVVGLTAENMPDAQRSGIEVYPQAWDPDDASQSEGRPSLALEV